MDEWMTIRRRVLVEGVSKRQILRETGMHWTTLEKILAYGEPPGYQRRREPEKPKIGPFLPWIAEVLKADQTLPKKQRHPAAYTSARSAETTNATRWTRLRPPRRGRASEQAPCKRSAIVDEDSCRKGEKPPVTLVATPRKSLSPAGPVG